MPTLNAIVCGHIDLSREEFDQYYVPDIKLLAENRPDFEFVFYIGGAEGTDRWAQEYLVEHGYGVVVCDKGEQNNVLPQYAEHPKVKHVNGFESYTERDQYMIENCRAIVLFLRNTPRSLGSGSFRNLITGLLGLDYAKQFFDHARSQDWESTDACIDGFDNQSKLKDLAAKVLVISC